MNENFASKLSHVQRNKEENRREEEKSERELFEFWSRFHVNHHNCGAHFFDLVLTLSY